MAELAKRASKNGQAFFKSPRVILLSCFTLVLGALIIWMGFSAYPLLGDDSSCFIPAAIQWKKGLGLINPVDIHTHRTDWTGQSRFMYYPPLFQYALALLMPIGTAQGAMLALALLGLLSFEGTYMLLLRQSRADNPRGLNVSQTVTITLSMMGLLTYLVTGTNGRPEVLAMLLISLLSTVVLWDSRKVWANWAIPVLLGLMAATHPISAFYSVCLLMLADFSKNTFKSAVLKSARNLFGAVAVYFGVIALSPYSIAEHLRAMSIHAHNVVLNRETFHLAEFIHLYFSGAHYTGYGLLLFVVLGIFTYQVIRKPQPPANQTASLFVLAIFWLGLAYFTFRIPARNYNVFCFMPLLYTANLWGLQRASQLTRPLLRKFAMALPILLAGLTSVGFIRKCLLFVVFLQQGVSLQQARQDYAQLAQQTQGTIVVSDSMWMLSENYQHMRYWYDKTQPPPAGTGLFILQGNIFPDTLTHSFPGYRRIFSSLSAQTPRLMGIPLGNSMPGYGFAAYIPEEKAEVKSTEKSGLKKPGL